MIEILHPGWLSLIVDSGRYGFSDIGVPPSAALDGFSFMALNKLLGNTPHTPAIEVTGTDFLLRFRMNICFAITGAKVNAYLDDMLLKPWTVTLAKKGSVLKVKELREGFRYYVGFNGTMSAQESLGSSSTNLECRFGGYKGRPLMRGDIVELETIHETREGRFVPEDQVPPMGQPHTLRVSSGPEIGFFTPQSIHRFFEKKDGRWYTVSTRSNRTGLRLEGRPLAFRERAEKSIISEGILPGTVQVPGDGMPIVMLYERTIGGYARLGVIIAADLDRLAHLRPRDQVRFELVDLAAAEEEWKERLARSYSGLET